MAENDHDKFKQLIAPHFDAAFNLARWLTGSEAEASDVLQDSSIKAFRFLNKMQLDNPRSWFLQITRNTAYTIIKGRKNTVEFDYDKDIEDPVPNAESMLLEKVNGQELHNALDELPTQYKEILILRELEELSYEETAEILQVPLGTVMSRLARARNHLKKKLTAKGNSL